jgi:hypothetical protein
VIFTKVWSFFSGKNAAANRASAPRLPRSVDVAEAEIGSIKADIDSGRLPISVLLPLTLQDCQIIGFILQTFSYADFNGRRALEVLDHLRGADRRTPNRALRDSEILPSLRERLTELPLDPQEKQRAETVLDMFGRLSVIRHTFAHWALKRHPTVDALIAMTFNEREAHRRVGHEPTAFTATFGVVPMPEVRANLASLEANDRYLASMVSDWWVRFMPNEASSN